MDYPRAMHHREHSAETAKTALEEKLLIERGFRRDPYPPKPSVEDQFQPLTAAQETEARFAALEARIAALEQPVESEAHSKGKKGR